MDVQNICKGLEGVVVDVTKLSSVNGLKGELIYGGYNINDIAQCSFEEICYLFLFGNLPNRNQLQEFSDKLKSCRDVPSFIYDFIAANAKKDHPMSILRTAVSMLSCEDVDYDDQSEKALSENAIGLVSKVATIAAAICRARQDKEIIKPDCNLDHSANFLKMFSGEKVDDVVVKTFDTSLVLHADHSFNASTFTARVVSSTLSDIISAVTAAIGSLKGPLHGGANTAVMKMLLEIGDEKNVEPWLEKALAEKKKVMGFGHRVYKVLDPRAKHLKIMSQQWCERVGSVKWFDISTKLEKLMFEKKSLNANVDFYSASTYYAMGFDPSTFTLLFAVSRIIGWVSHIREQLADNRLVRPKACYTGDKNLKFTPIDKR